MHFDVDSNVHILDRHVHDFVKCCLAAEQVTAEDTFCSVSGRRMPVEQLQDELCSATRGLASGATTTAIVKYIHLVMNRLVWLIVSPPLQDRIITAQSTGTTSTEHMFLEHFFVKLEHIFVRVRNPLLA